MDLAEIPFDISFGFDSDLREVPHKPDEMAKAVTWLAEKLQAAKAGSVDAGHILSHLGSLCRILERYSESEGHLRQAVDIFNKHHQVLSLMTAKLRLAHTLQWQKRFTEADGLFEEVLSETAANPSLNGLLDFAYQHYGKSLFDQQEFASAASCFEKALQIRRAKGEDALVDSSELALNEARRRERLNY